MGEIMRKYFIVYAFKIENSVNISNSIIKLKKRVSKIEDIEFIESHIKSENKYENVKLISWKKLSFI